MTLQQLYKDDLILLECISGSRAYGLSTPQSDTDIKGVFILPQSQFYGLEYIDQVSNPTNDVVFYELKRFMELLSKNNPNILELLGSPEECVLRRHSIMKNIKVEDFLSKLCKDSFGGYAMTQVKKAKGLNKKIMNPMNEERKTVLDFCYVSHGQGAIPVMRFLEEKGLKQEFCGLSKVSHMHDVYGLYYNEKAGYAGLVKKKNANDVSLSSISKGEEPIALMSFNESGYSKYCKDYKEYWDWVKKRNEARYTNTIAHGKNYDAKNMMHTFRLLAMAEEIGKEGTILVKRPDRDFLLKVKQGEFVYEDLVKMAEEKIAKIESIYEASTLPERPDIDKIEKLLVRIREELYFSK